MQKLLQKVETELENISNKGLSSSNLDLAYKLIDIYKDIKESEYYDCQTGNKYEARSRDSRGRFMEGDRSYNGDYDRNGTWEATGRYNHYPLDERTERYLTRMREGMENYDAGRSRYRGGESQDRMVEGMEMTMAAIVNFVESLVDFAETTQEKEIVRKYVDRLKKV